MWDGLMVAAMAAFWAATAWMVEGLRRLEPRTGSKP